MSAILTSPNPARRPSAPPMRAGRRTVVEELEKAIWLLDNVPDESLWELRDRFPMCDLVVSVRWSRRHLVQVTAERIQRALKCSRATAYRYLAALRELGELDPDAFEREEQEASR